MGKTLTAKHIKVKVCKCGEVPGLKKNELYPPLWKVVCSCGRTGISECDASKAIKNWNSGYVKLV